VKTRLNGLKRKNPPYPTQPLDLLKKTLAWLLRLPPAVSAVNRRGGEAAFAVCAGLLDGSEIFFVFLPNWLFLPLV